MSTRFPRFRAACLATVAVLAASTAAMADDGKFTFGLWGDMPYAKNGDEPKMAPLYADINASDILFSIYDGDTKDGSSKCTDDSYVVAGKMFDSLAKPVVYVPGDNEWTDCHRTNNGGYDNLERLAHLRKTLFNSAESFGQARMPLERQGEPGGKFAENTRFTHGGVIFVGLNVPGSNNNKVNDDKSCTNKSARTLEQCAADNAEYEERDAANIKWMADSFALAKKNGALGIVLTVQADPGFDNPNTESVNERDDASVNGYTNFMNAMVAETKAFKGQVLFVHGDTHYFIMDKPLLRQDQMVPNFTRVQTFGSPNIHWVKVTVDPTDRDLFTVRQMIVDANR